MSEQLCFDGRLILIYLAIKYEGDYNKMLLAIENHDCDISLDEAVKTYESLDCHVLTLLDYDYPEKLKKIWHPPLVLFYYGDISLLDKHSIAVVGSREYNEEGKACTEKIVSELDKDIVIVSGLAKGIDAIAHECAINNGARTIAVLGSGIDYCYPTENKELFDEIKKKHLLISEYPFKSSPDSIHFPTRNRIVIGLSDAVYVPQINCYHSGTMSSLNLANESGRLVFVAPHHQGSSTVNNALINEGAILADSASQMINELGWKQEK